MNENDEFLILYSADSSTSFSAKSSALKSIDNYTTTFKSESTLEKILSAIDILNQSDNINKEIYLFTDFQGSTFNSANYEEIVDKGSVDDKIKLYTFDLAEENIGNLSVSNLKLENAIIELNKILTFSANISNYSSKKADNILASLFINDKRVAQQSINLDAGTNRTVKFETQLTNKGLNEVRIELEEDNIIEDNIAYFSFLVPEKITVLLLFDQKEDIYFLETALESLTTSKQIEINSFNINENRNYSVTDYNIIILVTSQAEKISGLSEYMTEGGKLLFIPPSNINENGLEKLRESIKLPSVISIINTNDENYSEFGKIDFQHPIFISLFDNSTNPQIESRINIIFSKKNRIINQPDD
jgi:hypothetical protein